MCVDNESFASLGTRQRYALKSEAGLPKQSVVVVSQTLAIDKSELREKIGTVSKSRIDEIVEGIKLLVEPREIEEESN